MQFNRYHDFLTLTDITSPFLNLKNEWKIMDESQTSSPNILPSEIEDYGRDLILF